MTSLQGTDEQIESPLGPLFSLIDISSLHLRNRFAMAPVTQVRSPGGVPTAENTEHYRRRAAGGVDPEWVDKTRTGRSAEIVPSQHTPR